MQEEEKGKLMFLIGAGASCPMGIPTMKGFTEAFEKNEEENYTHNRIIQQVKNKIEKKDWDLESMISSLKRILFIEEEISFQVLELRYCPQYDHFVKSEKTDYNSVLEELLNFIRNKCLQYDESKASKLYRPILDLTEKFTLHLFTTNYDSIIEDVCIYRNTGFEDGFVPSPHGDSVWNKKKLGTSDTVNLYKLHGSISWYKDSRRNEIFKVPRDIGLTEEINRMTIYPGEIKEAFYPPYLELFSQFIRILFLVRQCFIIGSSLRDKYIADFLRARVSQGNFEVFLISPDSAMIKKSVFKNSKHVKSFQAQFENLEGLPEFFRRIKF